MYAVAKTSSVNFMLVKTFPTCIYCMLHGMSFKTLMIMVLENSCIIFPNIIIVTLCYVYVYGATLFILIEIHENRIFRESNQACVS